MMKPAMNLNASASPAHVSSGEGRFLADASGALAPVAFAMTSSALTASASEAFPISGLSGLSREETGREERVRRTPSLSLPVSIFLDFLKAQPALRWAAISILAVSATANALLVALTL